MMEMYGLRAQSLPLVQMRILFFATWCYTWLNRVQLEKEYILG